MSSITIRNLDDSIKAGLRLRAARHGCSMEQEVRNILQQALTPGTPSPQSFAELVNRRFKNLDAEDLPVPARQTGRNLPTF
jgi:plasmid stability protein